MALLDDPGGPPDVPGYLLSERLGGGGSGTVWAATRQSDAAPVAVKVVPVGTGEQADAAAREFAVLARVDVEGLVGFHEAVALTGEPEAVALVLERVGGGSLEQVVRARGHLSVGESVTILAPVARALAGLHSLGVVHGDVTPGNVLVERTGRPVLADLGVATLAGELPGDLYGTEGFVAPEVADRGVVTSAADVYAVGALAWWCVTGSPPEPVALRRPLAELAPGLPPAWQEVTARALSGDPMRRPTASEVALAYFDSAPCEPLRLVVGTDETSLLTQRLRQSGEPSSTVAEPEMPSRGSRAALALRRWAHLRGRSPRWWIAPRTAAGLGTATVLVGVLVWGGLMAAGHVATPEWITGGGRAASDAENTTPRVVPVSAPSSSTAPSTAPSSTAPSSTAASSTAASSTAPSSTATHVVADRSAAVRAPRELMQALADLRSRAMNSGSVRDIEAFDAPASPALASDTAALTQMVSAGRSYDGVRLTVRSARLVSGSEHEATVDAVVDTAAYQVVGKSGPAQARPARLGDPLRFHLLWTGNRWRVERVEPAT